VLPAEVKIHNCRSYDFLASLFRLQNNELILERFDKLPVSLNLRPDKRIADWVEKTRRSLTSGIRERLSTFFDRESFFALFLTNHIKAQALDEPESLIDYLSSLSDRELTVNFLCSGHGYTEGSSALDPSLASASDIDLVQYVSKNMAMPTKQKAILLKLCDNPADARKQLMHLLIWYNEKIFRTLPFDLEAETRPSLERMSQLLQEMGAGLPGLLTGSLVEEFQEDAHSTSISLSFFYEIIMLKGRIPALGEEILVVGHRYLDRVIPAKKKTASVVDLFEVLSSDKNLRILSALSKEPLTTTEVALSARLTNVEVTDYLSQLLRYGIISSLSENGREVFSVNPADLSKRVSLSLERLFGESS
jgi:DNA-binding transcriptional ArsR family regulator